MPAAMGRRLLFLAGAFLLSLFVAWALVSKPNGRTNRAGVQTAAQPTPAASPAASPTAVPVSVPSESAATASPTGSFEIAIVIDDCGQWLDTERAFLALPVPLTLSVLPHVRYTAQIAQEAAAAGKGVMLHLPMEPASRDTAGRGEITTAMTDAQVIAQTEDDLAQVPGAAGVNNHEGGKATADARVMRDVIGVVKAHGLFFIDSRTSAQTVAAQTARDAGVPQASRSVFLDDRADKAYTEQMLEAAVEAARRNGSAIAIGHPKPTTLAALQDELAKMQAEGARFVLASELTR
jgi:polysaccharide deacetylase 2 family uncharacterized protein YibQ